MGHIAEIHHIPHMKNKSFECMNHYDDWMPHDLTEKKEFISIYGCLLKRDKNNPFFKRMIPSDEIS